MLALVLPLSAHSQEADSKKPDKSEEQTMTANVAKVIDGDSLQVEGGDGKKYEVQVEGTDAPELKQEGGKEATETLEKMVGGKEVKLTWTAEDTYGRLLAQIHTGDKHVNLEMIKAGMAWHFKRYNQNEQLAAAEIGAREAKRGIWAKEDPQAPWDYRRATRTRDKPAE